MTTKKTNKEIIDEGEATDEINSSDKDFLIKLDKRYFITRDANQFRLSHQYNNIDKKGNKYKTWVHDGYFPYISSLLINYVEICSKTKIKNINELIKVYSTKLSSFKDITAECSNLIKNLHREIFELNYEIRSNESKIKALETSLTKCKADKKGNK